MDQVNEALKLMEKLGINPLYVLSVVFLTMLLKAFDPKNKFKQGYVLFPLLSSLAVCLFDRPFLAASWIFKSIIHAGIGSYAYNLYVRLIRDRKAAK